jgi:hypothetical protein
LNQFIKDCYAQSAKREKLAYDFLCLGELYYFDESFTDALKSYKTGIAYLSHHFCRIDYLQDFWNLSGRKMIQCASLRKGNLKILLMMVEHAFAAFCWQFMPTGQNCEAEKECVNWLTLGSPPLFDNRKGNLGEICCIFDVRLLEFIHDWLPVERESEKQSILRLIRRREFSFYDEHRRFAFVAEVNRVYFRKYSDKTKTAT